MNDTKTTPDTTSPRSRGKRLRRLASFSVAPAVLAAGLVAGTGAANASVVGPYAPDYEPLAGCQVKLGTVPDNDLRAIAGVDVTCNHDSQYINAKVDLFRWDNGQWTDVESSGWQSFDNISGMSAWTDAYSVPGCRIWDYVATVNIGGIQQTFDYINDMRAKGQLSHLPTWDPTNGNC